MLILWLVNKNTQQIYHPRIRRVTHTPQRRCVYCLFSVNTNGHGKERANAHAMTLAPKIKRAGINIEGMCLHLTSNWSDNGSEAPTEFCA